MNEIERRRDVLFRRARGKIIFGEYFEKIGDLLDFDRGSIKFIGLEETDEVLKSHFRISGGVPDYSKTIVSSKIGEIISSIKKRAGDFYVFIDDDWRYCGAISPMSLNLIKSDFLFGVKILNDVLFVSADYTKKISLDYYENKGVGCIDVSEYGFNRS
ncbi:hypothetical protein [Paraburkholderia sp. UCT2]|uniref:hypothetical protein n=1 Tax=Paraburkholderia sp. UCT2 TaxID=2615208 RepID=UPI001655E325|nr:hypothetical protein [Paraburkholderia sp. UCT2]MBC8733283.1 hypothetical protein [Paraburkholderia sp. UCT2]